MSRSDSNPEGRKVRDRGYEKLPVATKTPKTSRLVAAARNEDLLLSVDRLFHLN
jgi:hypothetical protein